MHGDRLADDQAIFDELADTLAGVGVRDFAGLVGVEPDLALAAADDSRCETLLCGKIDPIVRKKRKGRLTIGATLVEVKLNHEEPDINVKFFSSSFQTAARGK